MAGASIGKYEVVNELGKGAMGSVYLVRHKDLGVERALKLLTSTMNQTHIERFVREFETVAKLGGAGVVPVHEAGVLNGRPYYVMEVMSGGSLRSRLRERTQLPWQDAATIVAELARTLDRCHQAGFVHRDVKPDNVLFDEHGKPRIADFGTVRLDGDASRLTRTGTLVGTPHYMAPEQLRAERTIDGRADIYALGVILHELTTGQVPYEAENLLALMASIESGGRRSIRKLAHAPTPPGLDAIAGKALASDPGKRYQRAGELARDLDALVAKPSAGAGKAGLAVGALALVVVGLVAAIASRSLAREKPAPAQAQPAPVALAPAPIAPPSPVALPPVKKLRLPRGVRESGTVAVRGKTVPLHAYDLPDGAGAIDLVHVENETGRGFFIGRTCVTWGQFRAYCRVDKHPEPDYPAELPRFDDDGPVVFVSWNDANDFCKWAALRLPKPGEWERAARGPAMFKWPWGPDEPTEDRLSWQGHARFGDKVAPRVGSFPDGVSPWGALDMCGTVWQWCDEKKVDMSEVLSTENGTFRGGSFQAAEVAYCEPHHTSSETVGYHKEDVGFRVALSE